MKRFILKTLLLLLPVIIIGVSMECLLRHIPNDYIYKKNYLDKHAGEIQLLILGSSETYFGINPDYFSQNTFNAAHVSQTLDWSYAIFSKYQENFDHLKAIIIPITYHTLWGKLETSVEAWRIKNYAIYYGIKTKSWMDKSEILNGKLGINTQRLFNYYVEKKDAIYWSKLGWGTAYQSENENDLEESGKERALSHTFDIHSKDKIKIFEDNLKILNSFAEFCNRQNVKLIFLTVPTYSSYRENLNKEQLNKMTAVITGFTKEHANCLYINWHENPDFTAEDFHDADHLDGKGAKKLSEKLILSMDSLQIFK